MALTNSNISYTGHVEKYIGTAYDKMAALYDQLDKLVELAEALEDGQLDELILLIPVIEQVLEAIHGFNNIYYGPLSEEPETKPDGTLSTQGDLYFNTTNNFMHVYTASGWERQGVVERTVVNTWEYEMQDVGIGINDGYNIIFPAYMKYVIETNNIQVWLNNSVKYTTIDFTETSGQSIRMHAKMGIGDKVFIRVGQVVSNNPTIEQPLFQEFKPSIDLYNQGQLWFDTSKARLFILYDDEDNAGILGANTKQWVSIASEEDVLQDGGVIPPDYNPPIQVRETFIQIDQPDTEWLHEGALWFKSDTAELFFLFDDADPVGELHWVKSST